jgi:hypothetical protein
LLVPFLLQARRQSLKRSLFSFSALLPGGPGNPAAILCIPDGRASALKQLFEAFLAGAACWPKNFQDAP